MANREQVLHRSDILAGFHVNPIELKNNGPIDKYIYIYRYLRVYNMWYLINYYFRR